MKKILVALALVCLVLVSCGEKKPVPKYEIEITNKWTDIGSEYRYSTNEYISVTKYHIGYKYRTIYPDSIEVKKGWYEEGYQTKEVDYITYVNSEPGDRYTATNPYYFTLHKKHRH